MNVDRCNHEMLNLLTIRPTGVVSKKLRGACMVAWTEKEQSFLILVFGKPFSLAPGSNKTYGARCILLNQFYGEVEERQQESATDNP